MLVVITSKNHCVVRMIIGSEWEGKQQDASQETCQRI